MTVFVSSDIHLNHRNIISYCSGRRRPNVANGTPVSDDEIHYMNEMIISNWNNTITPEDEVFILGDVAMGIIEKGIPLIRRMNGKKYLVAGNHDVKLRKYVRERMFGAEDLFVWVKDYFEYSYTHNEKRHRIIMSHFPMAHWNMQSKESIHLHGHLHSESSKKHINEYKIMDVGMDGNNLVPYKLDDVIDVTNIRPNRESHHD